MPAWIVPRVKGDDGISAPRVASIGTGRCTIADASWTDMCNPALVPQANAYSRDVVCTLEARTSPHPRTLWQRSCLRSPDSVTAQPLIQNDSNWNRGGHAAAGKLLAFEPNHRRYVDRSLLEPQYGRFAARQDLVSEPVEWQIRRLQVLATRA